MAVIGAFRLQQRVGRGGMGEVWRAEHVRDGTPVAVKLMTSERARDPGFADAFRREARAVAGLSHPAIVEVFDFGAVGEGGPVAAGSPFLAMEFAEEGTLAERAGRTSWPGLRRTLLELLDALAHAHARGVVHLDLKPSNVLVKGGAKLADFGIALWSEDERTPVGITGTPAFMAPEQIAGRWRDFGPWTDLYALGGVAWTLATGAPPWGQGGPRATGSALPRLHAAPPGFREWIARLLEPDPTHRYERAAEAAAALLEIAEDWQGSFVDPRRALPGAETVTASAWSPGSGVGAAAEPSPTTPSPPSSSTPPPSTARRPVSIAAEWRRPTGSGRVASLHGVGLGLYGLRPVPFVGREPERDVLWRALRDTVSSRTARAVVVQGEAGVGKSRLAEWLARRAHEAGAEVLTARHGDPAGPRDGVAAMVERWLVARDLDRATIAGRAARLCGLDRAASAAVTEIVRPRASNEPPLPDERPLGGPDARLDVLVGFVEAVAARRPVLLWLDDAQWGVEACRLAARLVGRPSPVLVLLTAREEALPSRPEEAHVLASLPAERLSVRGLEGAERRELVRGLLGITGELAERVEERSAGNPLFAVQLVGDWVHRGVLELRDGGFDVAAGADATVPDAIHGLWMRRVAEVVASRPADRLPLELAAVLGVQVDMTEWKEACDDAGVPCPADLVGELRRRGLAVERDAGAWAFAHGLLAESIVQSARDGGRLSDLRLHAGRGLHWTGQAHMRAGRNRAAVAVLDRATTLLDGHWPAWANAMTALHSTRSVLGDDPVDAYARILERAEARGDLQIQGQVHRLIGLRSEQIGDVADARSRYERARELCERAGDLLSMGRALSNLAGLHVRAGRFEDAVRGYRDALALRERIGDRFGVAIMLTNLGIALKGAGRFDESEPHLLRALDLCRELGEVKNQAYVLMGLATVAHARGHLDDAVSLAEQSHAIFERIGDVEGVAIMLTLTSEYVRQRGDPGRAADLAEAAIAPAERLGSTTQLASALSSWGWAARAMGDRATAAARFERAIEVAAQGAPMQRVTALAALAWTRLDLGDVGVAREIVERALASTEGMAGEEARCMVHTTAAAVACRVGDLDRARPHVTEAQGLRAFVRGEYLDLLAEVEATCGLSG